MKGRQCISTAHLYASQDIVHIVIEHPLIQYSLLLAGGKSDEQQ